MIRVFGGALILDHLYLVGEKFHSFTVLLMHFVYTRALISGEKFHSFSVLLKIPYTCAWIR